VRSSINLHDQEEETFDLLNTDFLERRDKILDNEFLFGRSRFEQGKRELLDDAPLMVFSLEQGSLVQEHAIMAVE
jgi:hypothetical protein